VQIGLVEYAAAACASFPRGPAFGLPATPLQFLHDREQATVLEVQIEDRPNVMGLVLVDYEFEALRVDVVAQKRMP
jgi:hypothetical protein